MELLLHATRAANGRDASYVLGVSQAGRSLGNRRLKLFLFGGAVQSRDRRMPAGDAREQLVEVSRADELLMRHGAIAAVLLAGELFLLEARVSGHSFVAIALREIEHAEIQRGGNPQA